MKTSGNGLDIHLTRESDLHGQAPGAREGVAAAGEGAAPGTMIRDAGVQTNPLMYLVGAGVGWLGRKGLVKAWKNLAKPISEEIGRLPALKSAKAHWEEYKPSKLWQRAKNAVLARTPLEEKAEEQIFDPLRAGKIAEKTSVESFSSLASGLAQQPPGLLPTASPRGGESVLIATAVEKTEGKAAAGLVKAGSEEAGKILGKSLLKKVPILGVGAGVAFAWGRVRKGDWVGAAGEMASGVASCFPGIGTGISVAIDAGLAGRDIYYSDHAAAKGLPAPNVSAAPASLQVSSISRRGMAVPAWSRSVSRPSLDRTKIAELNSKLRVAPNLLPELG